MNEETLETALRVLQNFGIDTTCGACMEIAWTGVTTNVHTCPRDIGQRDSLAPRCDGCKHWEPYEDRVDGISKEYGTCTLTQDAWEDQNRAKFSAEGGYVPVQTNADFGCVQFEAK